MKPLSPRTLPVVPALGVMLVGLAACKGSTGSDAGSSSSSAASAAAPSSVSADATQSSAAPAGTPSSAGAARGASGGAGGSGAAAAKLPPPCSLISAKEVSATVGYPVTSIDSSAGNDPDQISCSYFYGTKQVLLVLERAWTQDHFTADAAQEPGHPQPLSGVGTSAYTGANSEGPVLFTWERGVSVLVNGVSPVTADQVKFLAKVAVGQLDAPK